MAAAPAADEHDFIGIALRRKLKGRIQLVVYREVLDKIEMFAVVKYRLDGRLFIALVLDGVMTVKAADAPCRAVADKEYGSDDDGAQQLFAFQPLCVKQPRKADGERKEQPDINAVYKIPVKVDEHEIHPCENPRKPERRDPFL